MMADDRLKSLDILRTGAIFLIVLAHLPAYVPGLATAPLEVYFVTLGLGIFLFVSGYSLRLSNPTLLTWRDATSFCAKRVLRVFPLYVPALGLFILIFGVLGIYHQFNLKPFWTTVVIHLAGAQELMEPRLAPIPTLWFVGLIVLYYLAYIVLVRWGTSPGRMLWVAGAILAACVMARWAFRLVGDRFFFYFPAFVGGILLGQSRSRSGLRASRAMALISVTIMAACAGSLWPERHAIYSSADQLIGVHPWADALRLVFMGSGIHSSLFLAEWWQERISARTFQVVLAVSLSSYAIYLYHRPVLSLVAIVGKHLCKLPSGPVAVAVILVGIPLAFALAYSLQILERRAPARWQKPKAVPN